MSTVVQATCPGCKNVLRIPSDWLQQSVKCKHCGMVLQARAPAAMPVAAPPARMSAPPPVPASVAVAPPPVPRPVHSPAIPVAQPVQMTAPVAANGSAGNFDSFDEPETNGRARRNRRRRKSGA